MWIRILDVLVWILVFYMCYIQKVIIKIPFALHGISTAIACVTILYWMEKRIDIRKYFNVELKIYSLFFMYMFFCGYFVSSNKNLFIKSVFPGILFSFLMVIVCILSLEKQSIKSYMWLLMILGFISGVTSLVNNVYIQERLVIGLGNNSNDLAYTMLFGIIGALYLLSQTSVAKKIVPYIYIIFSIYIIILTGSRKSTLAILILIISWFVLAYFPTKSKNLLKGTLLLISTIIFFLMIMSFIKEFYAESILAQRMESLFLNGDETRQNMYKEALMVWKENMFLGIGFDNFRNYSIYKTYSHSTYVEGLASFGILGCGLIVIVFLNNLYKIIIRYIKNRYNNNQKYIDGWGISIYIVLIYYGVGMIHFYESLSYFIMGILIFISNYKYGKEY
ncbi:MAG: O-antigen ligase family protein [Paraclostridium sordellii]